MRWIVADPARFIREQDEMQTLALEGWLNCSWRVGRDNLAVNVDFEMAVHGRTYSGSLIYPEFFPASPPIVVPRDESERWTPHQYGAGGPLCLERRADNWHSEVTGADMLRSTFRLLSTETSPQTPQLAPSAHQVTLGQAMRLTYRRFVSTPESLACLAAIPMGCIAKLETTTIGHADLIVRFITQIEQNGSVLIVRDLPSGLSGASPLMCWPGVGWVFKSSVFAKSGQIATYGDLIEKIDSAGLDSAELVQTVDSADAFATVLVLLMTEDPNVIHAYSLNALEPRTLHQTVWLKAERVGPRQPAGAEGIGALQVGIVGLGSVGSKMAISLARSGIRRFLLIDDDILLGENVVRHELDWGSVGAHKTTAVAARLQLISAGIETEVRIHRVAGQESSVFSAAVLESLARCELIIDATARPEVFNLLAAVAKSAKKPLVWCQVFAGGYGGLIARARPDLDPNPIAVRDGLINHLKTLPSAPFKDATGYDVEETAAPAFDSDVGAIAVAATRLALDTLLRRTPSDFPVPVYLIGLRKEWVFDQPFDTHPVGVSGPGWESDQAAVDQEMLTKALMSFLAMVEPHANADGPSPA